ncbi:OmpA family protein [Fluviicola taffensis]|uniref:OmpA/MotB domain protein n=1 Tax=Fluviicola taffensis (strain DSM 16823 / NCIMB 13979 / RW262) TaxID=755732 RepID=F2IHN1_FLUTR|nr:OmpA family protein [Fluviicola taffensis]AEA44809.1 OmpA/MotB domain protein [Fluviicola taffensis DSM 16823]
MKKTMVLIGLFCSTMVFGQETLLERQAAKTKEKIKQRAENRVEQGIDKTLDKTEEEIENGIKDGKKQKKEKDSQSETPVSSEGKSETNREGGAASNTKPTSKSADNPEFKVYSKFDFVSGEKVLGYDDFTGVPVGDFPLEWNTNSSAEVVRIDQNEQRWLMLTADGYLQPDFISNMPENFTIEFDVLTRYKSSNILAYGFDIYSSDNPNRDLSEKYLTQGSFQFTWSGCLENAGYVIYEGGEEMTKNEGLIVPPLKCPDDGNMPAKVHFSIWRQKTRLRVYADGLKIIDLPRAFSPTRKYNAFKIGSHYMNFATADDKDLFLISNVRYAEGGQDTRSKLITEGKLVTKGILFASNSDQLKPESYGVLKEIATALSENPAVRVKIVGHTDSDGEESFNAELSKKRALAVKQALISEFKIEASRMETDGKGENEPTDSNATSVGKANNRRVEFLKL